jgi:hypothetical protein
MFIFKFIIKSSLLMGIRVTNRTWRGERGEWVIFVQVPTFPSQSTPLINFLKNYIKIFLINRIKQVG